MSISTSSSNSGTVARDCAIREAMRSWVRVSSWRPRAGAAGASAGAVGGSVRGAGADVRPFEVRVRGTGAFPSLARMNVIWVGVEGAEPLAKIARALESSLEPLGFPREARAWRAHATLARTKGARDLDRVSSILRARAEETFGTYRVDAVHLKKSVLTPQGAVYSVVETLRLGP